MDFPLKTYVPYGLNISFDLSWFFLSFILLAMDSL